MMLHSLLIFIICISFGDVHVFCESENIAFDNTKELDSGKISEEAFYKNLFEKHRLTQLDAVKSIQKFQNYSDRYKLIKMMLSQLFKLLEDAKTNVTHWGFNPGDPFPTNFTVRESMSKILESTAMFGDLILRLPDMVHDIYDKNKDWQILLGWSHWFCVESKMFEGASAKLLDLMAQEANLKPKEENYINPFKEDYLKLKSSMLKEDSAKEGQKFKKKKKEIKKGPRLSTKTEL